MHTYQTGLAVRSGERSARTARARSRVEDDEVEILQGIARMDERALSELYTLYQRPLTRFVARFVKSQDVVSDIVNETFWVVWRRAGYFRYESRVSTWIMGIARRLALRSFRERRMTAQCIDFSSYEEMNSHFDEPAAAYDNHDWITRGLDQLPLPQRETLELSCYLGLSCIEIATLMKCTPSTVKVRMHRARSTLRAILPPLACTG